MKKVHCSDGTTSVFEFELINFLCKERTVGMQALWYLP